ncbi:signal peptidase I [Planctomicrobium sp. SH661]|uniref:signal peptidase I n=1 Tax=Planctomicrobium sp. SH661 TaxID=3448124 RepID=UPI003F5B903C
MSKIEEKPVEAPKAAKAAEPAAAPPKPRESTRDTVESILFAFVLAFLFRTFEAEAFVIPTGSMAPTLYGRHKETNCSACGHHIVVGASHEVIAEIGYLAPDSRLRAAICPNCGFQNDQLFDALAFNGDRILVNKFPYEFGEPHRWDVFVFKYPSEPQTNYIKRLVGLPNETLRIRNGNLYRVEDGDEKILRKTPEKQRILQIPVYDDQDYPAKLVEAGWPERWAAVTAGKVGLVPGWEETKEGWQADRKNRTYTITQEQSRETAWLRYRHFFAMPEDWRSFRQEIPLQPHARLVGDFCGYNATIGDHAADARVADEVDFGPYWVPDLTLNFEVQIKAADENGELLLELCEGTSWYRCRIAVTSGEAVLEEVNSQMNERTVELARAPTPVRVGGTYDISFANVDERLCLWVNNSLIDFKKGALLNESGATGNTLPTDRDLTPVGIAARGLSATVSQLFLERDMYYRVGFPGRSYEYLEHELTRNMDDPEAWGQIYSRHSDQVAERTMEIGPEHFLAFGDNSPQSNDSRMWSLGNEAVPRKYLVGKAFWIYWPHGIPFLNGGRGFPVTYHYEQPDPRRHPQQQGRPVKVEDYPRYTLPFYPQFDRMQRIR